MGRVIAGVDYGRRTNETALVIFQDDRVIHANVWSRLPWAIIHAGMESILRPLRVDELWYDAGGIGDAFRGLFPFIPLAQPVVISTVNRSTPEQLLITHGMLFGDLLEDVANHRFSIDPSFRDLLGPQLSGLRLSQTKVRKTIRIKAGKGQDDVAFALAIANQGRRLRRQDRERHLPPDQKERVLA